MKGHKALGEPLPYPMSVLQLRSLDDYGMTIKVMNNDPVC